MSYSIDDTMPLPLPRGAFRGQIDTCPECYPHVRNFGALFLVRVEFKSENKLYLLLTPNGKALAWIYKDDSTLVKTDKEFGQALTTQGILALVRSCGDKVLWAQETTVIPSQVAQRLEGEMRSLGEDVAEMEIYLFTEEALRPNPPQTK